MSGVPLAADRWRRIEEIFHACIDLPQPQRAAFLLETCGPDEQLRMEIESLLEADYQESLLIAGIVDDATASLLEDEASSSGRGPDKGSP